MGETGSAGIETATSPVAGSEDGSEDGSEAISAPAVVNGPKRVPLATDETPCGEACGSPLSSIRINVDGRTLLMESCDNCDRRRWQLAGEQIDLQEALHQVGEHAGRRRTDA